ncbi:hypothetical protein F4780DRAFT_787365 [Xylariomycetidae sp. FL0641]|nr:hypothetical protein F4780DRAFT_787365 [Xylariomycetidae sp. FL0641]
MAPVPFFPEELIALIASFVPPSSDLRFALVSKQFLRCSQSHLAHHRRCERLLRHGIVASRNLDERHYLAAALRDPIVAYHLRTAFLDAYVPYGIDDRLGRLRGEEFDERDIVELLGGFDVEDLDVQTKAFARKHFYMAGDDDIKVWSPDWGESDDVPGYWRPATSSEIDRAVLLAVCPRLAQVDVAQFENGSDWPLNFLEQCIRNVHEAPDPVWPEGFQALRSLRLGIRLDERDGGDQYSYDVHQVLPLLVLPNIECLYLDGLTDHDRYPSGAALSAPPGSSPLKRLELHWTEPEAEQLGVLVRTAKSLRSIVFDECDFYDWEGVVEVLGEVVGETIEEIVVDDARVGAHIHRDALVKFRKLRQAHVDIADFLRGRPGNWDLFPDSDEIFARLLAGLPSLLEDLAWEVSLPVKDADSPILDDALARLLDSGHVPKLKAMAIDDIQQRYPAEARVPPKGRSLNVVRLPKTIEAAGRHGINIKAISTEQEERRDRMLRRSELPR